MDELTLDVLENLLNKATCPEQFFGTDLKSNWRLLASIYHPDKAPASLTDRASKLFSMLNEWHQIALLKLEAGTYGDNKPYIVKAKYLETDIKLGTVNYKLVKELGSDGISTVHEALTNNTNKQFFVKVARKPGNNDLLEREFRNLKLITAKDPDPNKELNLFQVQRVYVPAILEQFYIQGDSKSNHRANLLTVNNLPHLTLTQLLELPKFKNGLPREQSYWIFRRLLMTLWMSHLRGIVHGGVNPDHLLVYTGKTHGIVLIDWTSSAVINQEHIPLLDNKWQDMYPSEVLKKQLAQTNIDLYMAGKLLLNTCHNLPDEVIKDVAKNCLCSDPAKRYQDVCAYHDHFGALIEKLHGPRKFVELEV